MKKLYIFVLVAMSLSACTKWNYIDTGVSKNNEDKTMYEYLKSDTYNWALVSEMIEKADIVNMFDGTNPQYKEIMFLGPVDNSVRKWMYDNKYSKVSDVPMEECKKLILRYVFTTILQREEVPVGFVGTGESLVNGGVMLKAEANNKLWFYSTKSPFMGNPNILITTLFCLMMDTNKKGYIASSGIKTKTGVVHSLDDSYQIGNINL